MKTIMSVQETNSTRNASSARTAEDPSESGNTKQTPGTGNPIARLIIDKEKIVTNLKIYLKDCFEKLLGHYGDAHEALGRFVEVHAALG